MQKLYKKIIIYSLISTLSLVLLATSTSLYIYYGINTPTRLLKFYSKYNNGLKYYYDPLSNKEVLTCMFYVKSTSILNSLSGKLNINGKFYGMNNINGNQIINFNNTININNKNIKWNNKSLVINNNVWDNKNIVASNNGIEYDLMYFNNEMEMFIFSSTNGYCIYNLNFFISNTSFFFLSDYKNNIIFNSRLWT